MSIIKIYPDSVWTGLSKIGGIIGIYSVLLAIAKLANERRLKTNLADKILQMKMNQTQKNRRSCWLKFKNYICLTQE